MFPDALPRCLSVDRSQSRPPGGGSLSDCRKNAPSCCKNNLAGTVLSRHDPVNRTCDFVMKWDEWATFALLALGAIAPGVAALIAAMRGEVTFVWAAALTFFAIITFVFARSFLGALSKGDTPQVESSWGGFGGGLGGWRVSSSLALLLATLVSAGMLAAIVLKPAVPGGGAFTQQGQSPDSRPTIGAPPDTLKRGDTIRSTPPTDTAKGRR